MGYTFTILGRGRAGRALAAAWGDQARLLPHDAPEAVQGAEPLLLAVPDQAIPALAARFPGRCAHMSGSLHLEGLPCAHPLTSFDGQVRDWRGTPLAVTGELPGDLDAAFRELGFLPFALDPRHKALYHACAVLSSGHAATLWLGAAALLAQAGVVLPGEGLLPLARATVENLARHGAAGRTGPFVRGDAETIRRDLEALPEDWARIFQALGEMPS